MNFDPKLALKSIDGKTLEPRDLYRELKKIRGEHFKDLPIEFSVDDLFVMAQKHNWVHEEHDGRLRIAIG